MFWMRICRSTLRILRRSLSEVGQGKICFNFSQADFMFEVGLGNSSALFCDVPQILKPWFRHLSSFFTPSSVHFPFSHTLVRASVRPNNTVGLATILIAAKAVLYVTSQWVLLCNESPQAIFFRISFKVKKIILYS
jgi:hypothetical protein